MTYTTFIGVCASTLTSISLIPQLIKIIRERRAEDVSYVMLAVLFTGLLLWIYYGSLRSDLIIIVSNAFAALVTLATAVVAFRFKSP
jgi:MtN3 and saliva related transmembrane protein